MLTDIKNLQEKLIGSGDFFLSISNGNEMFKVSPSYYLYRRNAIVRKLF